MEAETAAEAEVSFKISSSDHAKARACVKRFAELVRKRGGKPDRMSLLMDIIACHANGTPLDFDRLGSADDFNLAHDVGGISRHIDRSTGKLGGWFLPRFRQRAGAAA